MLTHRNLTANIVQVEGVFRCDEDDVLLGGAAVLPHLRPDGEHELRARPRRDRGHDGAVRPGGVPRDDRAPPRDARIPRAADPACAREAPAGRPPRSEFARPDRLGRRAARRADRPSRRRPDRLPGRPGLWADRDQPGDAPPAGGAGHDAKPGSVGPPLPGTECRAVDIAIGRAAPGRRGRRDRDPRAAGDAGLPARRRCDRGGHRLRTAGSIRATSATWTRRGGSSSSTA